jgi:hypothetical protein
VEKQGADKKRIDERHDERVAQQLYNHLGHEIALASTGDKQENREYAANQRIAKQPPNGKNAGK